MWNSIWSATQKYMENEVKNTEHMMARDRDPKDSYILGQEYGGGTQQLKLDKLEGDLAKRFKDTYAEIMKERKEK